MKLGTRIFFCYMVVFLICFSYPIHWVVNGLRTRYLECLEDPLVDQANILAELVETRMTANRFDPELFADAFKGVYARNFSARIYSLIKKNVDMRVYITDAAGRIVFDSENKDRVGEDYSKWRDVALTLSGQYGARTTREDMRDPASSVLYVAAPIMVNGDIAGVLTVGKPSEDINDFLSIAKPRIIRVGLLSFLAAILLGLLVSTWIARPIKRLTRYADDIRRGKRSGLPRLDGTEIGEMGVAFEKMREALEGKRYVEQYVQKLTHEIKSPLSGIRGAAELMEEEMPAAQRTRFLENIKSESNRIQAIVDRMLALSVIQTRKNLKKIQTVSFATLVGTVVEGKKSVLSQKRIRMRLHADDHAPIKGDPLLLIQAISNIIENAIAFSPPDSRIDLYVSLSGKTLKFITEDNGSGIPEYAVAKVFDTFFSLRRPDTGKKSTGLGLNFVKEVAALHNGDITLENRKSGGVRAVLTLPA